MLLLLVSILGTMFRVKCSRKLYYFGRVAALLQRRHRLPYFSISYKHVSLCHLIKLPSLRTLAPNSLLKWRAWKVGVRNSLHYATVRLDYCTDSSSQCHNVLVIGTPGSNILPYDSPLTHTNRCCLGQCHESIKLYVTQKHDKISTLQFHLIIKNKEFSDSPLR